MSVKREDHRVDLALAQSSWRSSSRDEHPRPSRASVQVGHDQDRQLLLDRGQFLGRALDLGPVNHLRAETSQ